MAKLKKTGSGTVKYSPSPKKKPETKSRVKRQQFIVKTRKAGKITGIKK